VREALRIVQAKTPVPTLPEIAALLLRPTGELADPLATDVPTLAEDVRDVALALQDLSEGELAGMFEGPTSPGPDFGAGCVVLDLSAMYNSEAIGILMICAAAFQRAVINDLRDRAEAGDEHTRKTISVYDECWKVIGQIGAGGRSNRARAAHAGCFAGPDAPASDLDVADRGAAHGPPPRGTPQRRRGARPARAARRRRGRGPRRRRAAIRAHERLVDRQP